MSINIRTIQNSYDNQEIITSRTIDGGVVYSEGLITAEPAIYEISTTVDTTDGEFKEIVQWVKDNIPDSDMKVDWFDRITTIELTIYTKESMMAFKLRWL